MKTLLTRRMALWGLLSLLGASACSAASGSGAYGVKVRFAKNTPVVFPDFDLTYMGRRHVATKAYPRGFDYDDFKISRGEKSITVSWSAGTGDIGPTFFEFDGQKFSLELRHAQRFSGRMKADELVIEKK